MVGRRAMDPGHCGTPGNERADTLAKLGSQGTSLCRHTRVTRTWLQAQVRQRLKVDWADQFPPDPLFPIAPSATFPSDLRKFSRANLHALFRLQSDTTPSDPFPNELAESCVCGGIRTLQNLLLECPLLNDARNDLVWGQRWIQAIHGSTDGPPTISRRPRVARVIHGSCHSLLA